MMEFKLFALRSIHDEVTGEFANVGIVLYSESARVLKAKFTTQYSRLSGMFGGAIDGDECPAPACGSGNVAIPIATSPLSAWPGLTVFLLDLSGWITHFSPIASGE